MNNYVQLVNAFNEYIKTLGYQATFIERLEELKFWDDVKHPRSNAIKILEAMKTNQSCMVQQMLELMDAHDVYTREIECRTITLERDYPADAFRPDPDLLDKLFE